MSEREASDMSGERADRKISLLQTASFNPFADHSDTQTKNTSNSTTEESDSTKDKNGHQTVDKQSEQVNDQTEPTQNLAEQQQQQQQQQQSSQLQQPQPDTDQQTAAEAEDSSEPSAQQKTSTVTIASASTAPEKRVSSSRQRMERELERMKKADENERLRQKAKRRKEVKKAVAAMYEQKQKDGVTMTPDVEESRAAIRKIMIEEERMALEKDQKKLRQETKAIQDAIDDKYGLKDKKQGHDLLTLAEDFHHNRNKDKDGLPELVRRELTDDEIKDLKMVFDMFDVKGRGYITSNDVKRAASMLGFKAKSKVFHEMIAEVTGEKNGKVTFVHFLQFVVRGQGDGDDPLEDIVRCFRMLDRGQKGYLTTEDLRCAADEQKVPLSNRAIREMMQEADLSGDARVTSDEFIHIMLQTSMFHAFR